MNTAAEHAKLENLEPKSVWRIFAGIAAVPRPSKREEKIRAHVKELAASFKLESREDRAGNLLISVPPTKGCEQAPPVVLQGHLDMVCEKNADAKHDFDRDPIRLKVEAKPDGTQIVTADGTTLGADNGIGVALALAAATDPAAKHGPLEILCTVDEEAGMGGAKNIEPSFFKGRRMLNLDSEEDDALYIGCAGGVDSTLRWSLPLAALPSGAGVWDVRVTGLKGGHSGGDIHLNRTSAIALLAQLLQNAAESGARLVRIRGGSMRNAIPREASAIVAGPAALEARLKRAAEALQAQAAAAGDADAQLTVQSGGPADALTPEDTQRVVSALAALPHGVLAVVPEIPGLVKTSNGVTIVTSAADGSNLRIEVGCLSRSSSKTDLGATAEKIAAVARLAGAGVERANEYPGWEPNVNSPVLAACRRVYEKVFQRPPRIASIHAGLECGIIGERVKGMDMVSFGPNIQGAHSPDEVVEVASVRRLYEYLTAVLRELADVRA